MGHPLSSTEHARHALLYMWRIRKFEEAVEDLFGRGMMHGTMHLSIGQEASPTGMCMAMTLQDQITSTHRGHGHCIAKGADLTRMIAELLGKKIGYCGGRGGSMHLAEVTEGHFGGNGIVGAGVGIAMGAAMGIKQLGHKKVAVGFVGDGGMNTGRTWEAINMAVINKLPFICLVDNNQYAVETFIDRVTGGRDIAKRGSGFGLPSFTIDGQDVLEVNRYTKEARERALAGEGPTLINALTYRYYGHNVGEKGQYRTQEEIADWRNNRDPIDRFSAQLISEGLLSQDDFVSMQSEVTAQINAAVEFAEQSPYPDLSTIYEDVDSGLLGVRK